MSSDGFQSRVFSAIALTAFRYVLEGGKGHTMDDVRASMHGYLQTSSRVLAAFE